MSPQPPGHGQGKGDKPPDARTLIEMAVARIAEQVPALAPLKLVFGIELRGRRDVQLYRVELPGPKISKSPAPDARVRIDIPRADFNVLAQKGTIKDWRRAFEQGHARANGPSEILTLITTVIERQESRARTPKARRRPS